MLLAGVLAAVALAAPMSAHGRAVRAPRTPPGPRTAPAAGALATVSGGVTVNLDRVVNALRPDRALGAALDGHGQGEIAQIYTPANLRAMRSAGLGAVTYRVRSELGVEAWHWNPVGRWSDPRHKQGYWTSSPTPARRYGVSYGYSLPRRGDTHDQANDTGYSRLDDGNPRTFWKSNPYLDQHFTRSANALHPQWALIDFQTRRPVDAIRIDWYQPYATRFEIQYWVGPSAVLQAGHPLGHWTGFPRARFAGHGGRQTLRLAARPLRVRFVRVLMTHGSGTAPRGSRDIRDRLGFAIQELYVGRFARGRFVDYLRHAPASNAQTDTLVSSTDPWHRASNIDLNTEQPSFERVIASRLTRGMPVLVPVSLLYGTPADAVNELRYLRARHIPVRGVELGEEPDGQLASPEDYAALYLEYARALHRYDPHLVLGGPGFQTSIPDWLAWPDRSGNRSWVNRFVTYLGSRGALGELGFFSFEWYPFDNTCDPVAPQLASASPTLANTLALQRKHGLPASVPIVITEYGYSAFAGQAEVDLPGALLNADIVARFLTLGGSAAYLYGYEPAPLMSELSQCNSWGNLALWQSDSNNVAKHPLATYWATRLLTQQWAQPGDGLHQLYAAGSNIRDRYGRELVSAYALRRPDGQLSLLLLNKDPAHIARVSVTLHRSGQNTPLAGALDLFQLSSAQYVWHPAGPNGYPRPAGPPAHTVLGGDPAVVTLPPYSVSVLRTQAPPAG